MLRRCKKTVPNSSQNRFSNLVSQMLVPESQMRFSNGSDSTFANADEEFVHSSGHQWHHLDNIDDCNIMADVQQHHQTTDLSSNLERENTCLKTTVKGENLTDFDIWSSSTSNYAFNCDQMTHEEEDCHGVLKQDEDIRPIRPAPSVCQGCKKIIEVRFYNAFRLI